MADTTIISIGYNIFWKKYVNQTIANEKIIAFSKKNTSYDERDSRYICDISPLV
jgi:hypothetical protein